MSNNSIVSAANTTSAISEAINLINTKLNLNTEMKYNMIIKASSSEEEAKKIVEALRDYVEEERIEEEMTDAESAMAHIEWVKKQAERKQKVLEQQLAYESKLRRLAYANVLASCKDLSDAKAIAEAAAAEFKRLKEAKDVICMGDGTAYVYVPDMELNQMTREQRKAYEAYEARKREDESDDGVIEAPKTISEGAHKFTIEVVETKDELGNSKGTVSIDKNGYHRQFYILKEKETGYEIKKSWLMKECECKGKDDLKQLRQNILAKISNENNRMLAGMSFSKAVEYLGEHEFTAYVINGTEDRKCVLWTKKGFDYLYKLNKEAEEKAMAAHQAKKAAEANGLDEDDAIKSYNEAING